MSELHKMELHESIQETSRHILRVPGGWIYYNWDYRKDDLQPVGTFVPDGEESRLDYFAEGAMKGILSNCAEVQNCRDRAKDLKINVQEMISVHAFDQAEEMLREREKRMI